MPGTVDLPPDADHVARQPIRSVETEAFNLLIDRIGVRISFAPKALIFHENDPAERVYKVIGGSVCTCKILGDGRRQIGGFCLPGDFFGFECADAHTASAEALTNTKILAIKKSKLAVAASRDAAIEHQLLLLMARELARSQERVFLLLKNAQDRVGEFLLDMERRAMVGNAIELPMKRQDIADYLGLTVETISRILTCLENGAAIEIPTRRRIIVLRHFMLKAEEAERNETPPVWSKQPTNGNNLSVDRRRKRPQGLPTNRSRSSAERLHRVRHSG